MGTCPNRGSHFWKCTAHNQLTTTRNLRTIHHHANALSQHSTPIQFTITTRKATLNQPYKLDNTNFIRKLLLPSNSKSFPASNSNSWRKERDKDASDRKQESQGNFVQGQVRREPARRHLTVQRDSRSPLVGTGDGTAGEGSRKDARLRLNRPKL